ncbi:hypothetical protein ACVIW2_005072 [Bradyrhizobium huanghuaihaiense]
MASVSVTAKRFYAATVIKAAGCSAETFRSWRTRNGLFPETHGSASWNKFSIIDMCVVWIVAELTSRGVAAQMAVNAAVAAAPALTELCDYGTDAEENDLPEIVHQIWFRIAERKAALALNVLDREEQTPVVRLVDFSASVEDALHVDKMGLPSCILLNLSYLMLVVGQVLLDDVDLEGASGERIRWIGQFSKLHRAHATPETTKGKPRTASTTSGKRKAVRK